MPRLTPILIGRKMKRPPSVVRNVLVVLVELGLVAPAARGLYELTSEGEELLTKIQTRNVKQANWGIVSPQNRNIPT
jgi:DNA-binding IclR family transcriptional regulator